MTTQQSSNATRPSLIERATARDPEAWRELVELYGPLIGYWCRRCGRDEHTAADCIQEVFASVSRSIDRFEMRNQNGAFRGWLWTITRNKLRDENKRTRNDVEPLGGSTAQIALQLIVDPASVPDDEPSDPMAIRLLIDRAMAQIQSDFQPRSWQAFWRSAIDQIPTEIVASELGISNAAVRQARSRILRSLRQQLGDAREGSK